MINQSGQYPDHLAVGHQLPSIASRMVRIKMSLVGEFETKDKRPLKSHTLYLTVPDITFFDGIWACVWRMGGRGNPVTKHGSSCCSANRRGPFFSVRKDAISSILTNHHQSSPINIKSRQKVREAEQDCRKHGR